MVIQNFKRFLVKLRHSHTVFLCLLLSFNAIAATSEKTKTHKSTNVKPSKDIPPELKDYTFQNIEPGQLKDGLEKMGQFQAWLGDYVDGFGQEVDNLFGSDRKFDRIGGSSLDIILPTTFHADGRIDTTARFRAKLALPKTEDRWKLIISNTEEGVDSDDDLANSTRNQQQNNNGDNAAYFGVRFRMDDGTDVITLLDTGFNFRNIVEPDPFARLRFIQDWNLKSRWQAETTYTVSWERFQGGALKLGHVADYPIDERYLFRSNTAWTWWNQDTYVDVTQLFYLYHRIYRYRALAYHLDFNWNTIGAPHLNYYNVGLNWRERVYKEWLFVEIEPAVSFDHTTRFRQADPRITLSLEMHFYQAKK